MDIVDTPSEVDCYVDSEVDPILCAIKAIDSGYAFHPNGRNEPVLHTMEVTDTVQALDQRSQEVHPSMHDIDILVQKDKVINAYVAIDEDFHNTYTNYDAYNLSSCSQDQDCDDISQNRSVGKSPPMKSRLRSQPRKEKNPHPMTIVTRPLIPQTNKSRPARPVLYSQHIPPHGTNTNAGIIPPVLLSYDMTGLVKESWMSCNTKRLQPLVYSFLLDSKRSNFIDINIQSQRHLLSTVATCVATLLDTCMIGDMYGFKRSALSFMSIDLWLEEVANECMASQANECSKLPALVSDIDLCLS
ncbi:hypothetical protein AZE42_07315 [Rhizopogon vesiculosus]|uniref:Uncharacterized protein n=1 Tax=Rhizopogon vesiculosus TaxID=180088 RepID=A0A1J8QFA3_9AGAM|nr:hypothetical protein AZE42_07315 [Rhizopogon vesiculosus]